MAGMEHQRVIDTIANALQTAPDVRALFLSGSYGNGLADAYSDIDFILVAKDGATDAIAARCRQPDRRDCPVVGPHNPTRPDKRDNRRLYAH